MPERGIIRRQTGRPDVYKVTETLRKNGKPDNKRKCIGQFDVESGMLIPNNAYYEFYGQPAETIVTPPNRKTTQYEVSPLSYEHSITAPGATWLITWILHDLGVADILDCAFGTSIAEQITLVAAYMVSRGNVMEYTGDWCNVHVLKGYICSQSTSWLFSKLSFSQRMKFFKEWVKRRIQDEYIAYDVTSFSSYSQGITDLEWGYNRDKEKLPQVNMALYLGQSSKLPVFYLTYKGSIVDKSHLQYMMAFNDELGIQNVSFVLDCGFCSTANLEYMREHHYTFIVAVEIRHKSTKAAIDKVRAHIDSMEYLINGNVRGIAVKDVYYRVDSTMHVFFDGERKIIEDANLKRTADDIVAELQQFIDGKIKLDGKQRKKYEKYFDLEYSDNCPTSFVYNYSKIDKLAHYNGFFCLLSNDALSSAQILETYRRKDSIEKGFDEIKNYIDMKRLRTHYTDTTDGKIFCAFIALIAAMHLQNKLGKLMAKNNLTKDKIILELEKMQVVQFCQNKRQYTPLSKLQKSILIEFGLTESVYEEFLTQ
jgi:hypothetical protein